MLNDKGGSISATLNKLRGDYAEATRKLHEQKMKIERLETEIEAAENLIKTKQHELEGAQRIYSDIERRYE